MSSQTGLGSFGAFKKPPAVLSRNCKRFAWVDSFTAMLLQISSINQLFPCTFLGKWNMQFTKIRHLISWWPSLFLFPQLRAHCILGNLLTGKSYFPTKWLNSSTSVLSYYQHVSQVQSPSLFSLSLVSCYLQRSPKPLSSSINFRNALFSLTWLQHING